MVSHFQLHEFCMPPLMLLLLLRRCMLCSLSHAQTNYALDYIFEDYILRFCGYYSLVRHVQLHVDMFHILYGRLILVIKFLSS